MSRWYSDRPHPDEIVDLRYERTARDWCARCIVWRCLIAATLVSIACTVAFVAVPAVKALVDAARPASCQTLTGAECTALAQDGGW